MDRPKRIRRKLNFEKPPERPTKQAQNKLHKATYMAKLKADPEAFKAYKLLEAERSRERRRKKKESMTDAEQLERREQGRLRQQAYSCAFANTPKYQQVKGQGRIVTKGWILDCHKQKRLLPWRRYRLGNADSPDESSEEEEVMQPSKRRSVDKNSESKASSSTKASTAPSKAAAKTSAVQFEEDESDSGGDTEDELRRVKQEEERRNKAKASPRTSQEKPQEDHDPYEDSTDEEEAAPSATAASAGARDNGSDSGLPDLPDFFSDKHFFLYGDFPSGQQRLLIRYIAAYNGEVEDYMSHKVKYVITAQKWDDNFEQALSENPNLVFVKPKWIYTCHEKNKLVPYQAYIVVP